MEIGMFFYCIVLKAGHSGRRTSERGAKKKRDGRRAIQIQKDISECHHIKSVWPMAMSVKDKVLTQLVCIDGPQHILIVGNEVKDVVLLFV